jgi:hypothetical protein
MRCMPNLAFKRLHERSSYRQIRLMQKPAQNDAQKSPQAEAPSQPEWHNPILDSPAGDGGCYFCPESERYSLCDGHFRCLCADKTP